MNIITERNNRVFKIVINREEHLNALNSDVLNELLLAIEEIEKDNSVTVVIITGAGQKAFIAGADITHMLNMTVNQAYEFARKGQIILSKIENSKKFYIAAINGFCLGGGCELSLACDMRIASNKSKFGQPEVGLGIIPGFGGTQRLTRTIGVSKSKELIATGSIIDSEEAYKIGLVNYVVEEDELMNKVYYIAEKICKNSSNAVSASKLSINASLNLSIEDGLTFEALTLSTCFAHPDQKEGMDAFVNKRKVNFD